MADEPLESPERPDNGRSGSDSARNAMRAAALAAATSAGAVAARRALARGSSSGGAGGSESTSTLVAVLESAWDAAKDHILPHAEDAMEAIGRYLGEDAPEVVRDRLVPRLVDGFESARADEGGTSRSGGE
jgi:hypothetical protein